MAHRTASRILCTSTSTGTGSIVCNATGVAGFAALNNIPSIAVSDTFWYFIEAVDANLTPTGDYEEGLGTYSAANTFTRTTVLASSNGGAAVNFVAGTKLVGIGLPASKTVQLNHQGAIMIPIVTSEPSAPLADHGLLYFKKNAGEIMPRIKKPDGVDHFLQRDLALNGFRAVSPGTGTAVAADGVGITSAGTIANPTLATTNSLTKVRRFTLATSTTAGNVAYIRHTVHDAWRGNAANEGGFRFVIRCGLNGLQTGMRAFFGLSTASAPTNVDPTTTTADDKIGLAINANTGNWNLIHNNGTAAVTLVALGATFPVNTTDLMEMVLACAPNSSSLFVKIQNFATGGLYEAEITTNLPDNNIFLSPIAWVTNNAQAAAASVAVNKWTLESDF